MSQFFRNLLDRHQQSSVVQAESRIVAPRPKSIFEGDTETVFPHQNINFENNDASPLGDTNAYSDSAYFDSTYSDSNDGGVSPITSRNNRQAAQINKSTNRPSTKSDQALAQQNRPKNQGRNIRQTFATPEDDNVIRTPNVNEAMESTSVEPQAHLFSPEAPGNVIENQNNVKKQNLNQQTVNSEQVDSINEPADSQNSRPSDPLEERIQTLLQHFEEPTSGFTSSGKPIVVEQEHLAAWMNTDTSSLNTNTQVAQKTNKSRGLLQPPGGLTEIQSALSKHLEKISAQAPADPVVNVTIGRIEVKASQPSPNTQTQDKHQPSGVMSLDEYLAQRNRKQP